MRHNLGHPNVYVRILMINHESQNEFGDVHLILNRDYNLGSKAVTCDLKSF